MTTFISSVFHTGLFRKIITVKTLNTENYQSRDFQNVVYHFPPSKLTEILGNLSRFQLISNCLNVKYFRQLLEYKADRPHFGKLIRLSIFFLMHFMSFMNYRKSKAICKSSLNSHVYWDTLHHLDSMQEKLSTIKNSRGSVIL